MRFGAALIAGGVLIGCLVQRADAIDRTLGSDVPKPAASGAPWSDGDIASLDANVDIALAGAPVLRGAHVGLVAVDASDGRVLYQRNGDDLFQPASSVKLLVGSVALERLGVDFRFHTDAVGTGPIVGGVLSGSLIVRAGGDPFLNAADFDKLAATLAAQGVSVIRDGVVFDVSRYEADPYPPGWEIEDLPYGYAAPIGSLAFEHNSMHISVAPGAVVDGPAVVTILPFPFDMPGRGCHSIAIHTKVVPPVSTGASSATDTVDLSRDAEGCTHVVGTIPFGATPDELDAAVVSPIAYAQTALGAALTRHAITVGDATATSAPNAQLRSAPPGATVLWMHDSEPLGDIVGDIWQPSDNLAAEMLLREISVANATAPGTTLDGIAAETAWLKKLGVDTSVLGLSDGSGVSAHDEITPRTLVTILQHDWNGPLRSTILDDLPIAGVRGTLRTVYRGTQLQDRVFAKTGTTSRVSALAGYCSTIKHGTVIFAFTVDEFTGDASTLRDLRARVLTHFIEQ